MDESETVAVPPVEEGEVLPEVPPAAEEAPEIPE